MTRHDTRPVHREITLGDVQIGAAHAAGQHPHQ
jgi:hypothetical protein